MSNLRVSQVNTRSELKDFIEFPYKHYKNNQYWTPQLLLQEYDFYNPKKNPFFEHAEVKLFVCYKNNIPVGRLSVNINYNYNEFHKENIGFWGSFETDDSIDTVSALFSAAADFFKKHKISIIRGPFTFSTNEISGLLVNSFDTPPMIMMPYNFDYYEKLLLANGHYKAKDLFAYFLPYKTYQDILNTDISKLVERYKFRARPINFKKFDEEINILLEIYNDAWEKNWGFVPMSYNEFLAMGKELKMFVPEKSVLIAYINDTPAGFLISVPDFNFVLRKLKNGKLLPFGLLKILYYKRQINQGRVITLGISHKFRKRGLDIFLIQEAIRYNGEFYNAGCELSWILEDNYAMNKILMNYNLSPYKIYRVFEKQI